MVPGPLFFHLFLIHALGNIRRLFMNGYEYAGVVKINAVSRVGVADFFEHGAGHFLHIHITFSGDFTAHNYEARGGKTFHSHVGVLVLS